jgi:predicted dehydrogenase
MRTHHHDILPTEQIGLGIIGCGNIAYWSHLRIAQKLDRAKLVAAADPDPGARKRAEDLTGIVPHRAADELLARPDVDAVIISGPTHLHADLAIAACEAGKHIYLEKPLAASIADGQRVMAAVSRSGVEAMLGFNRRFHPAFEQARNIILSGKIGRVRAVQSTFCEPSSPDSMPGWKKKRETGGGVLLDLASHHVDLTRWFLGDEVSRVSASISSEVSDHDSGRLELTMNGGAEVQGWFSFRSGLSDWMEFACDGGTLRVDRHSPAISLRVPRRMGYGLRTQRVNPTAAVREWRIRRLVRPSYEPSYRRSLLAFIDLVSSETVSVPRFGDGLRVLEVIDAAERSALQKAPVELSGS